ncbi:GPR endopeptidase [Hathewaya limosa]|uniref:Germination protease n=1 Tax=Hathewaya limosa TaxID=1536 RepID=A0ABU0JP84_HATLI|nr:GPR endopeptidase [Hathewaya limosa]AWZ48806.1 GPR endopeptidase [Clostridiaceae bacterium 14S0207]MDQ0478897.1 spore protease [Hathewaya limosa]
MLKNIRTDLALETQEMYKEENKNYIPGTEVKEYKEGDINITDVKVIDERGEEIIGKPKGSYITIEIPEFVHYDTDSMENVSKVLAKTLSPLIKLEDSMTALVVGLGNWDVTPDAVGPKVVSKLMITRHLKELVPDSIDEGIRPVCGISPGVLGTTGMETSEIIKGVVEKVKPNLVICVDALASRRMQRVNKTIQISSTGISPGAGVGNKRTEISERTIGIPVIAVGIPTVVDAATLANDTIDIVIDQMTAEAKAGGKFFEMLGSIDREEKEKMIKEVLHPYVGDLMVTPKEVDMVIESVAKILANGINIALQPALDLDDINKYIN